VYGYDDLKPNIKISEEIVECPVRGCGHFVQRQRKNFKRDQAFYCPTHGIYISPSTFEYADYCDNLLWKGTEDMQLLGEIFKVKRESRIARNNSEDALSWNIFRYLEKADLLDWYLSIISGTRVENSKIMYWSYSQDEKFHYSLLSEASRIFGERTKRGSEPDLIVLCDGHLFFIEAKFTASNKTRPSNLNDSKHYCDGADSWYENVFYSRYEEIAIVKQKYELMRFWLLGSWMAKEQGFEFHLVNLVLQDQEREIEKEFLPLIQHDSEKRFSRQCWEDIYRWLKDESNDNEEKQMMLSYFDNMTMTYPKNGILQKAFNI
jgi:hypothetical protein